MRAVTMYEANDGTRFNTESDAADRDELIRKVGAIMGTLAPCPRLSMGQFFRHCNLPALAGARVAVYRLWLRGKPADPSILDYLAANVPMGGTGLDRWISDGSGPVEDAWHRLTRIGRDGREWDQLYSLNHPEEATGEVSL